MIAHCVKWVTNFGEAFKASKLYSLSRVYFFDLLALVIHQKTHLPFMCSTHENILNLESALLD
jgi:hypothetical protein